MPEQLSLIVPDATLPVPVGQYADLLAAREEVCRIEVDEGLDGIDLAAVSSEGMYVAATQGRRLVVWCMDELHPRHRCSFAARIKDIAFGNDESQLLVGLADGRLVSVSTGTWHVEQIHAHPHGFVVLDLADADGVCVWQDALGRVWRLPLDEKLPRPLAQHELGHRLRVDAHGQHAALATEKALISIDIANGRETRFTADADDGAPGDAWAISRIGRRIYVWDVEHGHAVRHLFCDRQAFDANAGRIAYASGSNICLHDIASDTTSRTFDYTITKALRLTGDGAVFGGNDGSLSRMYADKPDRDAYVDRIAGIVGAFMCPDGRRLIVGDAVSRITLFDLATGRIMLRKRFPGMGTVLSVHLQGNYVIAGGSEGSVQIYDLVADEAIGFSMGAGPVQAVWIENDEHAWCGNYRGEVRKVRLADGAVVDRITGHHANIRTLRVNAGHLLVNSEDGHLEVIELNSGRLAAERHHGRMVYPTRFDAEGGGVYVGDGSGSVAHWNWRDDRLQQVLVGNASWIRHLSCDAKHVAAAGLQGDLCVWEVASGKRVFSAQVPSGGRTRFVCCNADFTRVLATGSDGTLRIFDAHTHQEVARGYNLAEGFMWVALDADGEVEWIWTDQDDALVVSVAVNDASSILPADSARRAEHLRERNSQTHVMLQAGMHVAGELADLQEQAAALPASACAGLLTLGR